MFRTITATPDVTKLPDGLVLTDDLETGQRYIARIIEAADFAENGIEAGDFAPKQVFVHVATLAEYAEGKCEICGDNRYHCPKQPREILKLAP